MIATMMATGTHGWTMPATRDPAGTMIRIQELR